MGAWVKDEHFEGYEVWTVYGDDWPGIGLEPCHCGAREHWVTRKVVAFDRPDDKRTKAYRYGVIHGVRPAAPKPVREVEDHKRRASGEAA